MKQQAQEMEIGEKRLKNPRETGNFPLPGKPQEATEVKGLF
jgi:hypothetical protein